MVNGPVPKLFEKCTRTVDPPTEMWITWRSVLPSSPGAAGIFSSSTRLWDAAQYAKKPDQAQLQTMHESGRSPRRVRTRRRWRLTEPRRRVQPGAAIARDERPQLH